MTYCRSQDTLPTCLFVQSYARGPVVFANSSRIAPSFASDMPPFCSHTKHQFILQGYEVTLSTIRKLSQTGIKNVTKRN